MLRNSEFMGDDSAVCEAGGPFRTIIRKNNGFKPGQSGNPNGRPVSAYSRKAVLRRMLERAQPR